MSTIAANRSDTAPIWATDSDRSEKAIDTLFSAHRPAIESYLRSRSRTREDSEDLVQNVFLKATRYFPEFRHDCPVSQWLLRIAANELKNYYRRLSGVAESHASDWESENLENLQQICPQACPDSDTDSKLTAERLLEVMRSVCTVDESNIIAMIYQGESFEEIAELLDIKSATVRSHFLRGRSKLLAHLVANENDFLGGTEAIRAAIEKVQASPDRLDGQELLALRSSKVRSGQFRSGCLKIARFLHMPVLLLMGVPWLN